MSRRRAIGAGVATVSLIAAGLALSGTAATASTGADNFADAATETGASWKVSVSNADATVEPNETVVTSDPTTSRQASVWLSWTAPADASILITGTSSNIDTVGLALFTAKGGQLAYSEDGAIRNADVKSGDTYLVQVSGVGAVGADVTGNVEVTLGALPAAPDAPVSSPRKKYTGGSSATPASGPANDSYSNAIAVGGPVWSYDVDNTSATTQSGEPMHLGGSWYIFHTVWLKWKAPASGYATFDTKGTSGVGDTGIAVFTGSSMSMSTRKGWADQGGTGDLSVLSSLHVSKGTTYRIQVGTVEQDLLSATDMGSITVNLTGLYTYPSNDTKGAAITKTGSTWSTSGRLAGATLEPGFEQTSDGQLDSVWWKWKASHDGTIDADTLFSGTFDTYLAVYELDANHDFTQLDFNDDLGFFGITWSSVSSVPVEAGSTYYFQVGTKNYTPFTSSSVVGDGSYDTGSVSLFMDFTAAP